MAFRWPYVHRRFQEKWQLAGCVALTIAVIGPLQRAQYFVQRYYMYKQAHIRIQCGRHSSDFDSPVWLSLWGNVDTTSRVSSLKLN